MALFLASCGSSNSSSGGTGTGGTGTGGSGTGNTGSYAAGIGGAGQTGAARFLIGVQFVGANPTPTVINSSGILTLAQSTPNSQNAQASALTGAIDPSGTFFYEAVEPGLWAFTINRQNGNLTEMSTSPYEASVSFESVAVDQLGKFVYAYDGINGAVYAFNVQAGTGQLTEIAGSPFTAGTSGPLSATPVNRIAISQDDNYLYVGTDLGIYAYSIDSSTGALTAVSGSPFGVSAGAGLALVAPSSGYLYETIGGVSKPPGIYGYSIDSSSGALTSISGSPFGTGCGSWNLTSPASGNFLFGTACGMYQINTSTGALMFLTADPEAANSDSWAVFDPNGAFVWILTEQTPCFQCQVGVDAYQVNSNGSMSLVPNSFLVMTNSEFGSIGGLAITQ
jgi:6-phosphogluconolactonase